MLKMCPKQRNDYNDDVTDKQINTPNGEGLLADNPPWKKRGGEFIKTSSRQLSSFSDLKMEKNLALRIPHSKESISQSNVNAEKNEKFCRDTPVKAAVIDAGTCTEFWTFQRPFQGVSSDCEPTSGLSHH